MSDRTDSSTTRPNAIAIIGMGCRFPGANSVAAYWRNLRDGVESITPLTDDQLRAAGVTASALADPAYVKSAAILDQMEEFDAGFFGFSPKEASIMDPQHRHFLECGWEAFENAGYNPFTFDGAIGTFAGCGMQAYFTQNLVPNRRLMDGTGLFLVRHTGNDKDFLATRLAYQFNLRGPSLSIQTACSTSLVAVHVAAQSLLSGECDMALAGGATIELPHRQGYLYQEGEILSHDGHCRSFDAASTGTVFGSGVGAVVLKRYDDAVADGDTIHAVLIGSAINNDGAGKVSYLAPSVDGQAAAISEALAVAGIEASTITYVETHGTGTQIGDPIEVTALTRAFRETSDGRNYCALGAVKSNIGHLDTAAGVAGLIKAVLALQHRQIPPTLHFTQPNPQIPFPTTPFFVNAQLRDWTLPPGVNVRRAGINSLGVGGTNAHVLLEEAPAPVCPPAAARPAYLLAWSGRSEAVLDAHCARFAEHLRAHPDLDLADAEFTLRAGRHTFPHRRVLAVRDAADALAALEARDNKRLFSRRAADQRPPLVFMFPGGGVQYPNMGRQLHAEFPVYRRAVDEALALLRAHWQIDLQPMLFPAAGEETRAAEQLEQPLASILSIFITEYALARLWMSFGLEPSMMTGHSLGEYTAACLAGVMSLQDTLGIVVARGRIFERLPAGAMLSVRLDEPDLRPHLTAGHCLAAVNAPGLSVVSGTVEDIEALARRLDGLDIENQRLRINVAAHSRMLEPFLPEFRAAFASVRFQPPQLPFISNVTGAPADPAEVTTAEYWVRHLRQTVRFSAGLRTLQQTLPQAVLVEVGPSNALSSLASLHEWPSVPAMRHPKEPGVDLQFLLSALGRVWAAGYPVDWDKITPAGGRRIPLPTYPFEHQRYWIDARPVSAAPAEEEELVRQADVARWFSRPTWRELPAATPAPAAPARLVLLGGPDDLAADLQTAVQERAARRELPAPGMLRVVFGQSFQRLGTDRIQVDPTKESDLERALTETWGEQLGGTTIVHLACFEPRVKATPAETGMAPRFDDCFFSLVGAARTLGAQTDATGLGLVTLTSDAFSLAGESHVDAEQHLALGALRVVPREHPNVRCRAIDLSRATLVSPQRARLLREVAEELGADSEAREVALRNGRRWAADLAAVSLAATANSRSLLKTAGVYLITGGLSGIGLLLARHLARTQRARLVLVSRSGSGAAAAVALREIEAQGEVMVAAADIADAAAVQRVLQQAEARWGRIDGVFHCAGLVDDGLLATKSREVLQAVLHPKVTGTRALLSVLRERTLDFVVLYSSTSSWLGLPGQVDYAAANAYLDAVAARSETAWPVRTIGWGAWKDAGIAARLTAGSLPPPPPDASLHPFLGTAITTIPGGRRYAMLWEAGAIWALDGHRNREGVALFPGTGYLELVRAAAAAGAPGRTVVINDLVFIAPLVVQGPTEVRLDLEDSGDFVVSSRAVEGSSFGAWVEHARGTVATAEPVSVPPAALDEIRAQCRGSERAFGPGDPATRQDSMLRFGPRWANLRHAWYGSGIALAEMALPDPFHGDLALTPFHPAVVDIATGFALTLVEGYATADWFYVPLSYRQVEILRPLPARFFSVARCADVKQSDSVTLDVTFVAPDGTVLARISGFTMKRLGEQRLAVAQDRSVRAAAPATALTHGLPTLEQLVCNGITGAEGMRVIESVLQESAPPHVFASPFDPGLWRRRLDASANTGATGAAGPGGTAHDEGAVSQPRPKLSTEFVAPGNEPEKQLAALWRDALGLAEVGIDDNYFELGGTSLGLVQLIMKGRKAIKASIPVADPDLLANPTIRAMARFATGRTMAAEPADGGLKRVSRDKFRTARNTIAPSA